MNLCASIRDKIAKEINNDPPLLVNKGVIADGVNQELDELRHIAYSGKDYLLQRTTARKRTDRHPQPENSLQQRVRLLHRSKYT